MAAEIRPEPQKAKAAAKVIMGGRLDRRVQLDADRPFLTVQRVFPNRYHLPARAHDRTVLLLSVQDRRGQ
jgi:hypothetical protein